MKPATLNLLELLYTALHEEFGIVVETDDAERLRQRLYPLRKEDESLSVLSFVISPTSANQLWIIRHGKSK